MLTHSLTPHPPSHTHILTPSHPLTLTQTIATKASHHDTMLAALCCEWREVEGVEGVEGMELVEQHMVVGYVKKFFQRAT